jgi:hypothetical protein
VYWFEPGCSWSLKCLKGFKHFKQFAGAKLPVWDESGPFSQRDFDRIVIAGSEVPNLVNLPGNDPLMLLPA